MAMQSQLEQLVIPESRVRAFPVDPVIEMGDPSIALSAIIDDDGKAHLFTNVEWGKESATPYAVKIFVFCTLDITTNEWDKSLLERELISGLGASISAAREHLLAVTSRGPHGPVLLPLVRISAGMVSIQGEEIAARRYGYKEIAIEPTRSDADARREVVD